MVCPRITNSVARLGVLSLPIFFATLSAEAQTLPTRPIVITSPYAAGGSTDFALRVISRKAEELGNIVIVIESRAGGAGAVAASVVKNGATDGTNLLLADVGPFGSNVTLLPNLPYDPVKDFKPITPLWFIQNVVAVSSNSPVNTLKELVELARKKPSGISYASPAVGASGHLLGSMFAKMTGAPMVNVPYRGALPAATDVVNGVVEYCFCSYSTIRGFVDGNVMKLLAIAADKRDPQLKDLPTAAEAGFPGLEMDVWFGLVGPAGMSDELVGSFNDLFVKSVRSQDVVAKLGEQAIQVMTSSPKEFRHLIASEIDRYRPIVIDSGAIQK